MAQHFFLDDVELDPERVYLDTDRPLTAAAESQEVATAGVVIEDGAGDYTFNGWRRFHVTEDACAVPRTWTGYIGDRRISRGGRWFHDAGRVYDVDLKDLNHALTLRVLRTASAKRPYETEAARLAWLLGSEALSGIVFDNGLVNGSTTQYFDEADFRKSYAINVFGSLVSSVKNAFAYWDPAAPAGEEVSLFYDTYDAAVRDSTLRISNDPADVNWSTTFDPMDEPELTRSPQETDSGVLFDALGITLYDENPATEAAFIGRDGIYSSERIGRLSTAQAAVAQWLIDHGVERDTIKCALHLPKTHVNLVLEGQRIEVKFEHFPGYEDFTWARIIRRTVRPTESWDWYDVDLELATRGTQARGGGGTGDFPHDDTPGVNDSVEVWIKTDNAALGNAFPHSTAYAYGDPTKRFLDVRYIQDGEVIDTPSDGFALGADSTAGDGTGWFPGSEAFFHATVLYNVPIYLDMTYSALWGTGYTDGQGEFVWDIVRAGTGQPAGMTITSYPVAAASGASGTTLRTGYLIITDPAHPAPESPPPQPAQPVNGEVPTPTPDGETTTFTTVHPFAPGSLRVFVDRQDQTAAVVSQDPAAGTFTLGFAPKVGWLVEVYYQGAAGGPSQAVSDLQVAIDATPPGGTLDITGQSFTGEFLIDHSMTLVGGTLYGDSSSAYVVTVTGDDVTLDGVTVRQCYVAVYGDQCENLVVNSDCVLEDLVYAGVLTVGAVNPLVDGATIRRISGDPTTWNAYGVSFSHELAGPNTTGGVAQNCDISYIPTWHALDTHAGEDIQFLGNNIHACRRAVFMTESPSDFLVDGNTITAPTAAQKAAAIANGAPADKVNDTRGISASGTGDITDNTGTGTFSAWWTNLGGWSGSASGNSPSDPVP